MPAGVPTQDVQLDVRNAWDDVVSAVPRVLVFLAILVVGWVVARLLATALEKLLVRVGLDRAAERGGLGRVTSATTMPASRLLARIVYYAVLLLALQIAFGVFGTNPVSTLLDRLLALLVQIVVAIVIVVVAAAVAAAVRTLVDGALGGTQVGHWLARAAQIAVLVVGVIAALGQVGIAATVTTPVLVAVLATVGGILVVGVGGGLVRPMQRRWERLLDLAEQQRADVVRAREARDRHARAQEEAAARSAALRAEQERAEQERAEQERAERERTERERAERERTERERAEPTPAHPAGPGGATAAPAAAGHPDPDEWDPRSFEWGPPDPPTPDDPPAAGPRTGAG